MPSPWVLLSDFDGTISETDASQLVLRRYGEGDWKRYDGMLARGEITFEKCIERQFRLIDATESSILGEYDRFVSARDGFCGLARFAMARGIPITIVSGGLRFLIKEFLDRNGLAGAVGLHAGEIGLVGGRMAIAFPPLLEKGSTCFKDDLVLQLKRQGRRVIYLGDGSSDFHAARASDLAFAIKGSTLSRLCREEGVAVTEFQIFAEVVEALAGALG